MKLTFTFLVFFYAFSSSAQLTSGLVAQYYFNNASTNDLSGNGYDVSMNTASPSTDRFGNANFAYNFDGTEYMVVPQSSVFASPDVSVCVWFKSTSTDRGRLLALPSLESSSWSILYHHPTVVPNGVGFTNTTSTPNPFSSYHAAENISVSDGEWHFLVGMRDASTQMLYLYVDCALIDSSSYQGTPMNPDQNLSIGRFNQASGRYFTGDLDDIRIYNRMLNIAEINMLCAEENPTANLEENLLASKVELFPNPAKDIVSIYSEETIESVKVYNSSGSLVLERAQTNQSFDISELCNGVYSVVLTTQKADLQVRKLVICR
ncbi:MAG: LamG-like jellyroll fold domain-containing protein [Fluviicola sp.]